jgi:cytochrome c oxidase cbb3-type subunit 2
MIRPAALAAVLALLGAGQEGASEWGRVPLERVETPRERLLEIGARTYGWHCLPCHGPEGRGDGPTAQRQGLRPRDFSRGAFMLKTSVPGEMPFDDDLYRTISVGIPVSGMPAFRELIPPEDRWGIVEHLKTLARFETADGRVVDRFAEAPARTPLPPAPDFGKAELSRGARLYRETAQCGACHGLEGRGDGPASALLRDAQDRPAAVPDLSRGEVEFKAGSRAEDVFRVLSTGLEGSAMPSFASLPEADRRDLAAFVTALYRPVAPGERLYLRKGCGACHTLGKGRHLGPDLAGVTSRRTRDWLRRWLKDPLEFVSADADARALLAEYKIPMPSPELGPAEIDAVIDFLATRK